MASAGPGRPRARLWLTAATLLLLLPGAAGMSCCYHAKDNLMCRDVCEQILSSKSDSRLKHLLQRAPEYCPESMGEVWGCINSSLPGVLKKSDGWVGLGCCELAIAVECRQACKQASSKNDILKICRKEYEACPAFLQPPTPFHCVWMRKLLSAEERTKPSSIEKLLQVAICCDCRHLQMEMQTPVFLKSWPATYIA